MKTIFSITIAAASIVMPLTGLSQTLVDVASPLADYQPFVDEKVTSWKAANDKVGQIGGWRAYAKEAREGVAPPTSGPTPMPKIETMPAPGSGMHPHAGHMQ